MPIHDRHYFETPFSLAEVEHAYGPNVHLLKDPYLFSLLASFSEHGCKAPTFHYILGQLYRDLLRAAINDTLPVVRREVKSRMADLHPEGVFEAPVFDPNTKVTLVALARAGILPAQVCFEALHYLLAPEGIRQDHIAISRKVSAEQRVIGTELGGLKIGGAVDGHVLIIPDPMGATGSTLVRTLQLYRGYGRPREVIALHLIVTPEYLAEVTRHFPEVRVYAIRLDRGLSKSEILQSMPGTFWKEERGLNDHQYIVPGAGGIGEILNNCFV